MVPTFFPLTHKTRAGIKPVRQEIWDVRVYILQGPATSRPKGVSLPCIDIMAMPLCLDIKMSLPSPTIFWCGAVCTVTRHKMNECKKAKAMHHQIAVFGYLLSRFGSANSFQIRDKAPCSREWEQRPLQQNAGSWKVLGTRDKPFYCFRITMGLSAISLTWT